MRGFVANMNKGVANGVNSLTSTLGSVANLGSKPAKVGPAPIVVAQSAEAPGDAMFIKSPAPPPDVAEIKAKTPRDGTVVDNLEAAAGVAAPAPAPCQA